MCPLATLARPSAHTPVFGHAGSVRELAIRDAFITG
jgi:hypothetical protein